MLPEKHEHHYDQKCKNSIGCLLVIKVALPNIGGGHATMHRLDVHRLQWLITENLRRHAQDLMYIYIYLYHSMHSEPIGLGAKSHGLSWLKRFEHVRTYLVMELCTASAWMFDTALPIQAAHFPRRGRHRTEDRCPLPPSFYSLKPSWDSPSQVSWHPRCLLNQINPTAPKTGSKVTIWDVPAEPQCHPSYVPRNLAL